MHVQKLNKAVTYRPYRFLWLLKVGIFFILPWVGIRFMVGIVQRRSAKNYAMDSTFG